MDSRKWDVFLSLQGDTEETEMPSKDIVIPIKDIETNFTNNRIFDFFNLPEYKKILIVGTGSGGEVYTFLKNNYDATGIALHHSDKKFAKIHYNIDIKIGDMHDMPFNHDTFDGVYSSHTFEHSIAPLVALFEVRRILRYDGKLMFIVPNINTAEETGIQHYSVLRKELWSHLLNLVGFEIISVDSFSIQNNLIFKCIKVDKECASTRFEALLRKEHIY